MLFFLDKIVLIKRR